jgi:hypothetical protein
MKTCACCNNNCHAELALLKAASLLVTPAMVKAALDNNVQYLVQPSGRNTPYRIDVQRALRAIAEELNAAMTVQAVATAKGGHGTQDTDE